MNGHSSNKVYDLEISLHRRALGVESPNTDADYLVELRGSRPDSAADVRPEQGMARFPRAELRRRQIDIPAYGQLLTESLFSDPKIREGFSAARASAEADQAGLRVRLLISEDAYELHSLFWETLHFPGEDALLTLNENLPFSRYLSSSDWRPVGLRAKGELRCLVVIANPENLGKYQLPPVDVDGEMARVRSALGSIEIDVLSGKDPEARPTLDNILARLRGEAFDLVYLVCHGALVHDEPILWLEDAQGQAAHVSGMDLALRFKELDARKLPRLVILASCESAGAGQSSANTPAEVGDGVRVALGPRLVSAGVPAVVAMQGQISMQTISECMPVFFTELLKDGQIDRAMTVARGAVRARLDFWMPVLFMRLKDGMIWYEPSFRNQAGQKVEFDKWPSLTNSINNGRCTAILGSGLIEPILGSLREIAQDWASTYAYPLSPYERDSLPQVAQYLGIDQDRPFLLDELGNTLRRRILTRFDGMSSPRKT